MKNAILLILVFFFAAACSSRINQQTEEQLTDEQFDSLRTVYYSLNDSLKHSWSIMLEDDNKKISNLQLLLEEIRKTENYSKDTLDSLAQMVQVLKDMRYDSVTVGNSDLIDQYDSTTTLVSDAIIEYTETIPDADLNPVINVLVDQIVNANNSVLLYRIRYDSFSEDFNRFLEKYKNVMSAIDSSGGQVYKRPMFRLVNDFKEEEEEN
ncbi:hypothetical protein [Catalinimonas niigatensis]|uniref:hypothetical protein n=1 Tax=Catalinimonas niigatensis TaxID=1397264 RepID=UPI0026663C0F|nr:hypothetical protein [Catalinimonas niigatensis]WPP49411.1 hypothetical protein PZB72_22325 [Catalinimonas niigatensis]